MPKRKSRKRTSDIDTVIAKCVEEIWELYDEDGSGSLDKFETKRFVQETLYDSQNGSGGMSEVEFEKCFQEFDADGSGTIEKSEMIEFIKSITGL